MRTFIAVSLLLTLLTKTAMAQSMAPDQAPDEVVHAALQVAADQLQVSVEELTVATIEPRDWPDSSLGCPQPGHAYAQIITEGYLVTVDTTDGTSEVQVHTDAVGQRAVIC